MKPEGAVRVLVGGVRVFLGLEGTMTTEGYV